MAFVIGQRIQPFPIFPNLAIFLFVTALIIFLSINIQILKIHNWWIRIVFSLFLSIAFTIVWYLTSTFTGMILSNSSESSFHMYIKAVEPLTLFLSNIDSSPISGLIFATFFLTCIFFGWYWVLFKNGANTWSRDIIAYNRRFGFSGNSFMTSPITLKIVISLMLMGGILFMYAALMPFM